MEILFYKKSRYWARRKWEKDTEGNSWSGTEAVLLWLKEEVLLIFLHFKPFLEADP